MAHFRNLPAKPRPPRQVLSYPRLIALGLAVVATACGGTILGDDDSEDPPVAGGIMPPYDSGPDDAGGEAGAAGMGGAAGAGGGVAGWAGSGGGGAPYPYDAMPDVGDEDADAGPPLTGDTPEPFDAGTDATVDAEETDAQMGGAAAESFQKQR